MHLLQTIIPMPMPIDTGGPIGPWTEGDTKILITVNITLLLFWVIFLILNRLSIRNQYRNESIFKLMRPMESDFSWAITELLTITLYILIGFELIFGVGYGIYTLIF